MRTLLKYAKYAANAYSRKTDMPTQRDVAIFQRCLNFLFSLSHF